ncbi:Gfo/Idh/MocA family protein [Gaoshiqia sediminis]|uniref:Gfo/Idh/MocA family oxidoreductase n=1 Tax=Gaoshiqia sediminis TaxID=2986998 RepID=A0AA41YAE2_9BACT|nr:Gfo/Idh/MocA family oxidoreductase [Gaoshiqia sediminis]MCW0484297.1 Gfo/Idh/MocA family oxidoreductase [Gaoshiqia sediminis]
MNETDRRNFLKQSAVLAAGVAAVPTLLNAGCSPNEKVNVGLIGCRGMGFNNLESFLKNDHVECVALCDVDRRVLDLRAAEVEKKTGKKPLLYSDFRQLIENKDIDAVIIGTPDHWHCLPMVYASEAGKHVYVEKPIAATIEECNVMVAAQKRYKNVVQVGQWQRSHQHWRDAVDYIQAGNLGRVRSVRSWSNVGWKTSIPVEPDTEAPEGVDYDFWLGPAPKRPFNKNRFHASFRWYWDYAGGVMTDWGVHLLDFALFGMNQYVPKSVMAVGGKYAFPEDAMETPDTMTTVYDFGDFNLVWDHTIGIYGANYKQRGHGVAFVGEYGTLVIDRSGWEVIPETKSTSAKEGFAGLELQKVQGDGLDLHVRNFLDCIKNGKTPNCDIETGAHIARIAHLGNIAYRTGRKVFWNHEKQEFENDPEANELVKARYRAPWTLPKV